MTPRFSSFIPFILSHETSYKKGHYGDDQYVITERDPDDPGGTTRYGIDFGEHREKPWKMTEAEIDKLTKSQATDIYWRHWLIDGIEQMPKNLGEVYFNCCTMSGRGQANLILGRTNTVEGFLRDEVKVFGLIAKNHPSSKKYVDGWTNRIVEEARFLGITITL